MFEARSHNVKMKASGGLFVYELHPLSYVSESYMGIFLVPTDG